MSTRNALFSAGENWGKAGLVIMHTADEYLDNVHHLLPAPRVVPQLLQILRKPDVDNGEIVRLISHDPSLTANVLRLSNSAFYGSAVAINSLDEAVTRLGSQQVYRLVVAVSGALALSPPKQATGIEANELLDHSATTAVAAQIVARDLGEDESLAFTAALLHDLGKIVVATVSPNFYVWVGDIEHSQVALLEAEKKVLGVTHAELGGRVLERWKFPANLSTAVQCHHFPSTAGPHQKLATYVYAGNLIAYQIGHGYGHQSSLPTANNRAFSMLEITPEKLEDYMERTSQEMKNVRQLFGMN